MSFLATPIYIARRNLVSSVLLTRTWENESVAELKRQAKIRGIIPKGNKATLIQRIQEHDKSNVHGTGASRDPPVATAVRVISTSSALSDQGIPSMSQPVQNSGQHFMVNIPDIPQPAPEFSVQIPYVPDFWDSSIPVSAPVEESLPKLLVVAGVDTHHGGGPSHNLLDANLHRDAVSSDVKSTTAAPTSTGQGTILDDITEDLGVPYLREMKAGFWKLFS